MADFSFYAFFSANKIGKTGLTVTTDVYDSSSNQEVSDGAATEIGGGFYQYNYTGIIDDYLAVFKTADATVDSQHVPAFASKKLASIVTCGTGSVNWEYTVTEPDMVTPIEDVGVYVSTDIAGTNIIANGFTDIFGTITFHLDPGTYYLWCYKTGYSFTNPDTEVVP